MIKAFIMEAKKMITNREEILSNWVLRYGDWRDNGIWIDTEIWEE